MEQPRAVRYSALMLPFLLALALARPADTERILVLDLEHAGVSDDDARILTAAIAEAAADNAVVVTSADLRTLSDLAAEQQSCGADSSTCLAELAGAVDVRRVIHGRVGRVDDRVIVQLSCFSAGAAGEGAQRRSFQAPGLRGLLDQVPSEVAALLGREPSASTAALSPVWGGVVLGVAAIAAGGTALSGGVFNATLTDATTTRAQKDEALGTGRIVVVGGALVTALLVASGGALLAVALTGEG